MNDPLRRWKLAGAAATAVIVLALPVSLLRQRAQAEDAVRKPPAPTFVGREVCAPCHRAATEAWTGSDHDHAMAPADESSVRGSFDDVVFDDGEIRARFFRRDGRFMVATRGPDGQDHDYEVAYTFGWRPLQQVLIPFPGGRLQCLTIAWDTERRRWFNLYPGRHIPFSDWLHWTRAAQTWNGMCAECHSTNLKKGFDPETRTFATTWSEIDVSCEACHGPGSRHVAWAELPAMARPELDNVGLVIRTSHLEAREEVELCAPCHSRRTELGDYDHTTTALLDSQAPSLLEEGLYFADGQILEEDYVYGSFLQSKMYRNGVRCSNCHDVHSLRRRFDDNRLCLQCHRGDVYDTAAHHFHKQEVDGKASDGARCAKCHMPERPYMVVDWRADHSLRVPRPDLTASIGVPNACSQGGCHADKPLAWAIQRYDEWYGKARKPHYGTVLAAGREGRPEALEPLVKLAGDVLSPGIVRATALSLLGEYPGAEAMRALESSLMDEEGLVRYTAVMAVEPPTQDDLVRLLAPLLEDELRGVRMQAAARLAGTPPNLLKPYQQSALAAALAEYEAAMTYSLDFAFAGHNLGNLYVRLGDRQKAEHFYRTAIEIDDLFIPAKVNLATLLNSEGRNQEAETLLRQVLEAHPEMTDVAYSLGLLLAEMGRLDEAAVELRRAATGAPAEGRIRYNLGLVLQLLGRTDEAGTELRRALELEPDNPRYLHALADHYARRGDLEEALELAQRLAAEHPEEPVGAQMVAAIERAMGQRGTQ